MPGMTETEAWALEDKVPQNPPKVETQPKPAGSVRMTTVDDFFTDWLRINKAEAGYKTPSEIIGEMARERISALM